MPTGRTRDRRQLSNRRNLVFPEGYTDELLCSSTFPSESQENHPGF